MTAKNAHNTSITLAEQQKQFYQKPVLFQKCKKGLEPAVRILIFVTVGTEEEYVWIKIKTITKNLIFSPMSHDQACSRDVNKNK